MNYLDLIKKTFDPDMEDKVLFCMIGVAGEAGEIANMAQKGARGDFDPYILADPEAWTVGDGILRDLHEGKREQLIGEMGGLFYFLEALCWQLGVTPEEVKRKNGEKVLDRLERGVIRGDGDDR